MALAAVQYEVTSYFTDADQCDFQGVCEKLKHVTKLFSSRFFRLTFVTMLFSSEQVALSEKDEKYPSFSHYR